MRVFEVVVPEELDQCRVDTVLRREMKLSNTRIKRAKFRADGILLDGKRVNTAQIVRQGQTLRLTLPELEKSNFVAAPGALDIVYEDPWLMVIDKPAGVAMYPGPGHYADTLGNRYVWHMNNRREHSAFRPVNRLDKGTSGLLVLAKSAEAHEKLQQQLHSVQFCRIYWALTRNTPQPAEGVIDAPIGTVDHLLNCYAVQEKGKPAQTEYRVLHRGERATLIELQLRTGRTHQIRVHMAYIGCPLLGDGLYGGTNDLSRPALHSRFLRLRHPFTGDYCSWESACPTDFTPFLERDWQ